MDVREGNPKGGEGEGGEATRRVALGKGGARCGK